MNIAKIRAHAVANYEAGWHWIVECWDDEKIVKYIEERVAEQEAATTEQALGLLQEYVDLINEAESNCY